MNDANDAAVTALFWTRRFLHSASQGGSSDYSHMTGMGDTNSNVYSNNNSANNSNGTSTTMDASSGDVDILNAFILLLGGFGVVMGIVVSTYFASVIFDKYCCCCPGFVAVGSLEEVDQGSVARKAGLWGLRLSERQEILKQVFAEKQTVYHARRVVASHADTVEAENVDEEVPQLVTKNEFERNMPKKDEAKEETDIEQGESASPSKDRVRDAKFNDNVDEAVEKTVKDEPEDSKDDADHERVCCICLSEYEEGCTLLTGSSCVHKFHYDCSMVWLLRHDECPYCRMLLVSPADFREAAIPLLGQGRIKELAYTGAVRMPVVDVVTSTTESIQTNDETEEHESQQTAAPDEEALVDLETGENYVDGEAEETVVIAEPDGVVQPEEGDIEMMTKPTGDTTAEPDLDVGDCDDAVHDSMSTAIFQ
jgi:hypothetical protein